CSCFSTATPSVARSGCRRSSGAVAPMNAGSNALTYAAMRSGVSRNGSTLTKTTSGTSSGAPARSRATADLRTCSVIGQRSGQRDIGQRPRERQQGGVSRRGRRHGARNREHRRDEQREGDDQNSKYGSLHVVADYLTTVIMRGP